MRRALTYLHRWLGIAGNLLFVVWFASALVMMYARMPALDAGDRLNRLPALDLDAIRVDPAQAAVAARLDADGPEIVQLRLGMAGDRPIYRFRTAAAWSSVYADTGGPMLQLSERQATAIAAQFSRRSTARTAPAEPAYDRFLTRPDQWTLELSPQLPLHRVRTGSDVLYVSDRTAEVVLETTTGSRFWGASGAVFHWLYFTPLRTKTMLWYQLVVWAAAAGCVLTLSGLAVGVIRLARLEQSPYTGIMRWHHYTGLVFGATAFTWVLSGALSMDPFGWQAGSTPSRPQRAAISGGPLALETFDLESVRTAIQAVGESFPPREVEFLQFAGRPLVLAYRPPSTPGSDRYRSASYGAGPSAFLSTVQPYEHQLIALEGDARSPFHRRELLAAATAAMPGANVVDAIELADYDAYYDDRRHRRRPLPVLRVRFDDPAATWLYLDPARGMLVHREQRRSRIDRWLYRGLHRLDFPGFYHRRPLWDIVVIVLLLGGLFSAFTSMAPAAKRLRRHGARLRR